MANKLVALFVEGSTEIEFYKAVVKYARDKMNTPFCCSLEWRDMCGIGNYKATALRAFKNTQLKHPNEDIYVLLCIDTDAFDRAKKPPMNKQDVKKSLESAGAKKVAYIEARQSIEDWFMSDYEGILSYLNLPKKTKRPSGTGQEALKALFKSANRIYLKGSKTEGLIKKLDIAKIISANCASIKRLCRTFEFDCRKLCEGKSTTLQSKT